MKKIKIYVGLVLLVIVAIGVFALTGRTNAPSLNNDAKSTNKTATQDQVKLPSFDKSAHSTSDPTSIWVIANKQHALQPKDYVPTDLVVPSVPLRVPGNESMQVRQITASALETMFSAAAKDGVKLMLSSGYRSYSYQVSLYGGYVKTQGQATADTQSARPGFSEHQTGLAADLEPSSRICELDICFKDTPEGMWVAANAYKYGFIIRYAEDKTPVTGYEFEPWHVRYVGVELATKLHDSQIETLEEFFDVTGGTSYTP